MSNDIDPGNETHGTQEAPESIAWIQAPHHGLLTKPGLEGAACYGAKTCVARPQRQVLDGRGELEQHLEASQDAVRRWLAGSAGR